ncbi:MAG: hypothetical protein HY903_14560 [Deltaproteobacteria bacterium]|nr:hypothetical protein [Deltaproteobacteria bacterium]
MTRSTATDGKAVKLPVSWENRSVFLFVAPTAMEDEFSGNISVVRHQPPKPMPLEALSAELVPEPDLEALVVLAQGFKHQGETQYHERQWRFVDSETGELIEQLQRIVLLKRQPIVVTYTHQADQFADHLGVLDKMFQALVAHGVAA